MAKVVNDQEFAAVSAMPGSERYSHFLQQIADWEEVWSLRGPDGWVLAAADDGRPLVPVWPHARYAEACALDGWAATSPQAIPLDRWCEVWLPGLARDGRGVAVFPLAGRASVAVDPERLAADLAEIMESYD